MKIAPLPVRSRSVNFPATRIMTKIPAVLMLASLVGHAPLAGATSAATSLQPLPSIEEAARIFLEQQVGEVDGRPLVTLGNVDSRLRLPLCDEAIEGFAPPSARSIGNVTVGVRCGGSQPWTIYMAARVALMRAVLVLARPVPRGQPLSADDLQLEERDASMLGTGYLTSLEEALGLEARSPLRAGLVLNPNALAAPLLVRRGERVTVLARSGGFEVRSEAEALEDGSLGELIAVKNLHSGRIVEGVVTGSGLIEVRV
jgi:flagella basal body P-ring formation protein FlgA